MRFHCANGLVVLRDYAVAHRGGNTGREHSYCDHYLRATSKFMMLLWWTEHYTVYR